MIIQGRIEDKQEVSGRTVFTISGRNYSTWDQAIIDNINKGDNIELETETSKCGKFENMKSMKLLNEKVNIPEKTAQKGSAYPKDPVGLAVETYCSFGYQGNDKSETEHLMKRSICLVKQAKEAFE